MKKRYAGLVDAMHMMTVILLAFGIIGAFLVMVSRSGSVTNGLTILVGVVLASLFLLAIAAIIDLLASIEVQVLTIAKHDQKTEPPTKIHPLSRKPKQSSSTE